MEDLMISLLPVIIIVCVWIFIMRRFFNKSLKNNKYQQNQDEMIVLLREIKDELKQINQNSASK
jgi:large-conductance mechanosensitive channel